MLDDEKKVVKNVPKVEQLSQPFKADSDPFGSYTGVPFEEGEIPVQDADDL